MEDQSRRHIAMEPSSIAQASPYHFSPGHSRNSSNASISSSPLNSSFSSRVHSRWPSSSSSLVTTPDSPVNMMKSALHDLVEEPAEIGDFHSEDFDEEEMCICKFVTLPMRNLRTDRTLKAMNCSVNTNGSEFVNLLSLYLAQFRGLAIRTTLLLML